MVTRCHDRAAVDCSVERLDEAMPSIIENYSAEISRVRFDE
jgi:hypothetical protein